MNFTIEELKSFITSSNTPVVKLRPKTFLGIAKQPHYENVWSNIYAFFLTCEEEHGLEDLFIKSLLDIVRSKINYFPDFEMNFVVSTERTTDLGGRIDILITSDDFGFIIENKIHHILNNNLQDYWESIDKKYKVGIILTLHKSLSSSSKNSNFISITHLEYMNKVMKNLPNYFSSANDKYIIFLKDFYQNVINMTNQSDPESILFYINNSEKINAISNLKSNFLEHIKREIELVKELLNEQFDVIPSRNDSHRFFACPHNRDLVLTIYFGKLLDGLHLIHVIVELKGELKKALASIDTAWFEKNDLELLNEVRENKKLDWHHYAVQNVILTHADIINLSETIPEKINQGGSLRIYNVLKDNLIIN